MRIILYNSSAASTRLIAMIIFLLLTGCNRDECPNEGVSWCDGDFLKVCTADESHIGSQVGPNYVTSEDCEDYNATCIEEAFEDDEFVYCGYTEETCPDDMSTICVGDLIGTCRNGRTFPTAWTTSLECTEQNWDCVENSDDNAVCTYVTEPCEPDGQIICHDGEFGNNKLLCDNGVWVPGICDDSEPCCILEINGSGACVDIEDQAELCVD